MSYMNTPKATRPIRSETQMLVTAAVKSCWRITLIPLCASPHLSSSKRRTPFYT